MQVHEYNELTYSRRKNEPWQIPADYFVDDEFSADAMLDSLSKRQLIGYDIHGRLVLTAKLYLHEPDTADLLNSILKDEEQARMDNLVRTGEVSQYLNEDGETVYELQDGTLLMNSRGPMW